MPKLIPTRLVAVCALALTCCVLGVASASAASGVPTSLRVVGSGGKVLADTNLRAGSTAIRTSRRANCFGPGNRGSGKKVVVRGPTPLGLLARAATFVKALNPLLVTDAFDFGLGLCGIGGQVPPPTGFWYLKVNHKNPQVGGDGIKLRRGDDVLWYLLPDFEVSPEELWLRAPRRVKSGVPFVVRVFSYADDGKRTPEVGARVRGAKRPTGPGGRTRVVLRRPLRLIARHGAKIPSNRVAVCVQGRCPRGR